MKKHSENFREISAGNEGKCWIGFLEVFIYMAESNLNLLEFAIFLP